MSDRWRGAPFKGWQWAEILFTSVLIWTQIVAQLVFDQLLVASIVGVLLLGLLVHIATWIVPMIRERRTRREAD